MKIIRKKVMAGLLGMMTLGSIGMVYANGVSVNDSYANDKELQEIFKVYQNVELEDGMVLSPNPMVEEKEEENHINVEKDRKVQIELVENASTGCAWHVVIEKEDIAKLISDEYKEINHEEGLVGAPGVHTWNFKGLKEGTTKVTFQLYQNWNPDNIYETKEYEITVER